MSSSELLKIGLIGCGEHSRENLVPSVWSLDAAQVVSVCDSDNSVAQMTAAKFSGARVELNFEAMINRRDVDAVIVAATPQIHYTAAMLAIQSGIHVFVEKPPTENRE